MIPPASALAALRDLLSEATGLAVEIGRPDEARHALFLWPWRVGPEVETKLRPSAFEAGRGRSPQAPGLSVHLLVLASPPASLQALDALERARKAVFDQAAVLLEEGSMQISTAEIPTDVLIALHGAAGISLARSLALVLRGGR